MRKILITLLALLPLPALAAHIDPPSGNAWDYYVIAGNVPVIASLLEAVKSMTSPSSNPEFRTLIATFATIGFVAVVFGSMRGAPERIGKYVIAIWILTYAMFSLEMDLVISDPTNSQTTLVRNVPAAIGLPATAIGTIGNWLTEKTEEHFTTPDFEGLKLSNGAMVNMNSMMLDALSRVRITDPYVRASLNNFFTDCVIPAVIRGKIDPAVLISSGDIRADLAGAKHPGILTSIHDGTGFATATCEEAYNQFLSGTPTWAGKLLDNMPSSFSFIDATGTGAAFLRSAMDTSLAWSSATGGTADTVALQQGMLHHFRDAYGYAAATLGADSMLLSLNVEQAKAAQKTGWYTTAELFREAVINMYAVMQAFIIGLAPIVMAAAVLPKVGLALMKGWAEVLIWLALWAPSFAIINFLMATREQTAYRQILRNGLTMSSDGAMSEAAVSFITQANVMMTMVPLVLWSLVKGGSIAMTSVMERASGASQAGAAAQKTAEGSFSAGNVSLNNMNANHHDLSHTRAFGGQPVVLHNSGGAATELFHQNLQAAAVGGTPETAKVVKSEQANIAQKLADALQMQTQAENGITTEISNVARNARERAMDWAVQNRASLGEGFDQEQQRNFARATAFKAAFDVARGAGYSKEESYRRAFEATLGTGGGGGAGKPPEGDGFWKKLTGTLETLSKGKGGLMGAAMSLVGLSAKGNLSTHDIEVLKITDDIKNLDSRANEVNSRQSKGNSVSVNADKNTSGLDTLAAKITDGVSTDTAIKNVRGFKTQVSDAKTAAEEHAHQLTYSNSATATRGIMKEEWDAIFADVPKNIAGTKKKTGKGFDRLDETVKGQTGAVLGAMSPDMTDVGAAGNGKPTVPVGGIPKAEDGAAAVGTAADALIAAGRDIAAVTGGDRELMASAAMHNQTVLTEQSALLRKHGFIAESDRNLGMVAMGLVGGHAVGFHVLASFGVGGLSAAAGAKIAMADDSKYVDGAVLARAGNLSPIEDASGNVIASPHTVLVGHAGDAHLVYSNDKGEFFKWKGGENGGLEQIEFNPNIQRTTQEASAFGGRDISKPNEGHSLVEFFR